MTVDPDVPPPSAAPDAILRAPADPHRRQILRLVQRGGLPAGQIAMHLELTQQAISQHLTVLKRAGLLDERREGTRRLYALRSESLQPLRNLLDEFWSEALARLKQSVEHTHPRTERSESTGSTRAFASPHPPRSCSPTSLTPN